MEKILDLLSSPHTYISFLTLSFLEIVLGIDNIIFLSILTNKLPKNQQARARQVGLMLAMVTRIILLLSLAYLLQFTKPLFSIFTIAISGRDLVLMLGGLFLIAKSTREMHDSLEGYEPTNNSFKKSFPSFISTVIQIAIIDIVFSLDSVITAIGLVKEIPIMIAAIVAAMLIMLFLAKIISEFVDNNPTVKILALSFLILIGLTLVAESLDFHIPKGYIYFAMAYSLLVEMFNLHLRKKRRAALFLHKKSPD